MLAGTRVRPRCKAFFHEEQSVYYRYITCQENGEWDHELFKCVPGKLVNYLPDSSNVPIIIIYNPVFVLSPNEFKKYFYNRNDIRKYLDDAIEESVKTL